MFAGVVEGAGFGQIIPPMFEELAVFQRVGESTEVVRKASQALYPIAHADDVPEYYRHRHCLKGHGAHAAHMLVAKPLRERTRFMVANLLEPLPDIGHFDVIDAGEVIEAA